MWKRDRIDRRQRKMCIRAQDYEIVDAVPETEEASTEAPQEPAI